MILKQISHQRVETTVLDISEHAVQEGSGRFKSFIDLQHWKWFSVTLIGSSMQQTPSPQGWRMEVRFDHWAKLVGKNVEMLCVNHLT